MPTRAGWALLAGSLASCIAGRAFGALELYVLGAIGAVAVALAVTRVATARPRTTIERRVVPERITVGGSSRVELVVTARDRRLPPLTLIDPVSGTVGARLVVGPLSAGTSAIAGYRLPTNRRGLLEVGPLDPQLTDPYGLARRRLPPVAGQRIVVLPAIEVVPPIPVGTGGRGEGAGAGRRTSAQTPNDDLVSLRPYVVGDDLRRVHWPASARGDDLVVRRDEHDRPGRCIVVLDARRPAIDPGCFEQAVSAAASLVHAATEAGDAVRLVITDGTDTGLVDPRRGDDVLLEHLALVRQHDDPPCIPPLDDRDADAVVLLGGDPDTAGAGLDVTPGVEVRVVERETLVPTSGRVVVIGPDESFGAVWTGWLASRTPSQVPR